MGALCQECSDKMTLPYRKDLGIPGTQAVNEPDTNGVSTSVNKVPMKSCVDLFVTQRQQRIHARCTKRRPITAGQGDHGQRQRHSYKDRGVLGVDAVDKAGHQPR